MLFGWCIKRRIHAEKLPIQLVEVIWFQSLHGELKEPEVLNRKNVRIEESFYMACL